MAEEQKAKDIDTTHRSTEPETTVVGTGLTGSKEANISKTADVSAEKSKSVDQAEAAPIAAHKKAAVPVVSEKTKEGEATEKDAEKPHKKEHKTLAVLGAGAGAGAVVGAASDAVSVPKGKSSGSETPERHHSLSRKLKSVFSRKHKDDDSKTSTDKQKEKKSAVPLNVKAANVAKQPYGKTGASSTDDLVSIYEEVSDREYEQHKGDPDYN